MKKRFTSCIVAIVMIVSMVMTNFSVMSVYAFTNFTVVVTKDNAPIRDGYYETKKVNKRVKKGSQLTVTGQKTNDKGNLWYKIGSDGYIFSGNVHKHNYKLVGNDKAHPHYANYECSCGSGYCSNSNPVSMIGCSQCYPKEVPTYDTNKKSTQQTQKEEHKHNYQFSGYSSTHPHTAQYKCSCGSAYSTAEIKKVEGCAQCYPHEHNWVFAYYEDAHPHSAVYKCSCGAAKCGTESTKINGCSQCYPHEHNWAFAYYEDTHPHSAIYKCSCGAAKCGIENTKINGCSQCYPKKNNTNLSNYTGVPIDDKYELITGNMYNLKNGLIYNFSDSQKQSVYSFIDNLHITLDICGLIPVVGNVCDGINVAFYLVERDYANAALSGLSLIPVLGYVSTGGKAYIKTTSIVVNIAEDGTAEITEQVIKSGAKKFVSNVSDEVVEQVIKNLDNMSDVAQYIVKNSDDYSDVLLRNIRKIYSNKTVNLADMFYEDELLITGKYTGDFVSNTGLKYGYINNENRIYHIASRHASNSTVAGETYFKVKGKKIFDTIDDVVANGTLIDTYYSRGRTVKEYASNYIIGTNGEDKLRIVLDGSNVITAFPIE